MIRSLALIFLVSVSAWAAGETLFVAGGDGIYSLEFDPDSGALSKPNLEAKVTAPSFLAVHPSGWYLFATSNDGDRETRTSSHLLSFFIEPNTASLHPISRVETGGTSSAYVEVDPLRSAALVANYRWGTVAGFRVGADGSLGERAVWIEHEGSSVVLPRQSEPHPHAIRVSPDGKHVYVPDLGTDEIFIYEFDETGTLRPAQDVTAKVEEGDGPRHLDFHPRLPVVYLINEISSRITMFRRDARTGGLTAYQSIGTLPASFSGRNSTAEIRVHPGGRFVYGSNRGHDSIAVFRADEEGFLSPVEYQSTGGKSPRHFVIHPSGKWLLAGNRGSGSVVVFAIDEETGALDPVGEPASVWGPSCLAFARAP